MKEYHDISVPVATFIGTIIVVPPIILYFVLFLN